MISQSAELQKQYQRRFSAIQQYRYEVWKTLTKDYFQQYISPKDAILDLGCGWGEFINQINAGKKYGMDLNPSSKEHLNADVEFLFQDCSQAWEIPPGSLDLVFTSNFFEHLPDKASLTRTLQHAFDALKPGGKIICMGPNIRCVPGAYWDFLDHHVALTERSLSEGLEMGGFKIVRALDRFLPYTMAGNSRPPLWTVGLYLRLPFIWRYFGSQFLVIGQK